MKTAVTPDQITKYRNEGFLYFPNFLDSHEVATLKAAVIETVASMGELSNSQVFTQRMNLWKLNDTAKSFMFHPGLGKMLCDLEGVEGFRVWHDQALIKEPYAGSTPWHMDNPFWSFYSRHAISIWIALEDATPLNGCMAFLPGSHKLETFEKTGIAGQIETVFKVHPEMKEVDSVSVPMKAGDCSFHNGLTVHAAGANMTRGRRIAMTYAYMPEGSTYNGNRNILPESYAKTLQIGDVLENEEQNPLVYSSPQPALA